MSPHLPEKLNLHRVHWSHSAELCNSTLEKSLLLLDHSQNKIKAFPIQFCQLQELIHLKLDDNELIQLPFKKKQFCKMCFLSAAHTKLPFSLSLYLSLFSEDLEKATSWELSSFVTGFQNTYYSLHTVYIAPWSWGKTQSAESINIPDALLPLVHGSVYRFLLTHSF